MDKTYKILIVVGTIFLVLFGIQFIQKGSGKIDYATVEKIEIKKEQIPSLYYSSKVNHKVSNVLEGNDDTGAYIELTYDNVSLNEITEYLQSLAQNGYVIVESLENKVIIVKESSENGKVITIETNYAIDKTKIKYSKGTGIINKK